MNKIQINNSKTAILLKLTLWLLCDAIGSLGNRVLSKKFQGYIYIYKMFRTIYQKLIKPGSMIILVYLSYG